MQILIISNKFVTMNVLEDRYETIENNETKMEFQRITTKL